MWTLTGAPGLTAQIQSHWPLVHSQLLRKEYGQLPATAAISNKTLSQ